MIFRILEFNLFKMTTYATLQEISQSETPFVISDNTVFINQSVLVKNDTPVTIEVCKNIGDIMMGFAIQSYDIKFEQAVCQNSDGILRFLQIFEPYFKNISQQIIKGELLHDPIFHVITTHEIYNAFRYRMINFFNTALFNIQENGHDGHDCPSDPSEQPTPKRPRV